jgi:integrase
MFVNSGSNDSSEKEPGYLLDYATRQLKASSAQTAAVFDSSGHKATKWELEGRDLERRKVEALEALLERERATSRGAAHKQLFFTKDDLDRYAALRQTGLAQKSLDWIKRALKDIWDATGGEISEKSMKALMTYSLNKYTHIISRRKVLGFMAAFLKHLGVIRRDLSTYQSFSVYLGLPKTVTVRRMVTERIIRREDVVEVLRRIDAAETEGSVKPRKIRNYRALTLLAAYTGMRPSTMQRLTLGQARTVLREEKPFIHVFAEQEKNRTEHYVPIAAPVAAALRAVLEHDSEGTDDAKPLFMFNSFIKWLERQKIPLPRVREPEKAHLWVSDFRKFAEQFGDIIGWDATNRKYVLAHAMTGVDWEHYKHPLPENVYDIYMRYWKDVRF